MSDQLNIGVQRQSYEPFEAVDSDAENSSADASLADNAHHPDNANVPSSQLEVESISSPPALAGEPAVNNTLNRYGIGDTVILARPEYKNTAPADQRSNESPTVPGAGVSMAKMEEAEGEEVIINGSGGGGDFGGDVGGSDSAGGGGDVGGTGDFTGSGDVSGGGDLGDGSEGDAEGTGEVGDGGSGPTGGGNDNGSDDGVPALVNGKPTWDPCDLLANGKPSVDANGNPVTALDTITITAQRSDSGQTGSGVATITASGSYESLPPIENLYAPFEGHFASGYRTAVAGMTNPNASWDERIINGVLATAVSPLAIIDMIGEGFMNAPNAAGRAGQLFARGNVATNTDTRVTSTLGGIVELTNAFNGAVGPFAGVVGVPARVLTVEELSLQRFQGAEATAAARATYGALAAHTPAQTLANIEGRIAGFSREVGFVVDSRSGQILGVTRSGLDNSAQMRLNPQTDFQLMSGNIFTHNHPLGGTFSRQDVATALGAGVAEFRAVTSTRTMSLTFNNPPANLFGKPEAAAVFMMDEQTAIIASYRARVAEGSLIPPADLAARLVYQSEYLMQQLAERNQWILYAVKPR